MRKRESIELSEDDWLSLKDQATAYGCTSWRGLLGLIAKGEIALHTPISPAKSIHEKAVHLKQESPPIVVDHKAATTPTTKKPFEIKTRKEDSPQIVENKKQAEPTKQELEALKRLQNSQLKQK